MYKMGCGGGDSGDTARAGGMGKGLISFADQEQLPRGWLVVSPDGFQNSSLIKTSLKSVGTHEGSFAQRSSSPRGWASGLFPPRSPESSGL